MHQIQKVAGMFNKKEREIEIGLTNEEFLLAIKNDLSFAEVNPEEFLSQEEYFHILQNIHWHQEENGLSPDCTIHCFELMKTKQTEKYYSQISRYEDRVYLLFVDHRANK